VRQSAHFIPISNNAVNQNTQNRWHLSNPNGMIVGIVPHPNHTPMLFNYFKVAFRNLLKKKIYSIINIVGLSVGAAAALLLFLYVQGEKSYDKFLPDSDRLYRVIEDRIYPDRLAHFSMIPDGFAKVFVEEIPEIEASTRLIGFPSFANVVRLDDKIFSEYRFFAADSNFFDVLKFKLLKGNPAQVLRHPNTIVLTASTAARYFGDNDPMGKTIEVNNQKNEVVGVVEDVPFNSHMSFDALFPVAGVEFVQNPSFYVAGTYTYVRLANGADPVAAQNKFPALVEKYAAGQIERERGVPYKKYVADGNGYLYFLQPVTDIHLHSQRLNELKENGNITTVRVLTFVGILILAIAGINFVNLATARAAERAREVGVRKVLGSRRKQLISQFLSESMLITAISIILAIFFLQLIIGVFNNLSQTQLQLDFIGNPVLIIAVLAVTVTLGVIAGLYPAFFIASLKPVTVLKGKFQSSNSGTLLRNGLVIFQFTVSIVLISATLIAYAQLDYMNTKSLGFDKEDLMVIEHASNRKESETIQNGLQQISGVLQVGSGNAVPGGYFYGLPFRVGGSAEIFTPKGTHIDDNYAEAMKLKVVDGRMFGPDFDDSLSVVINQRAAASLGLDEPVGSVLMYNANPQTPVPLTIVGVVEDFNYESLHSEVAPLVIMSTEGQFSFQSVLTVRIDGDRLDETVQAIQARWKDLAPNEPFTFSFLGDRLNTLYASENKSSNLLIMFTFIAIIIGCVGLFGLAAYTAHQRTKEIGVRKVLGASVSSIVGLLSKDFFKLVLIALAISTPLSWWMMDRWLQSFAYRVDVTFTTFVLAGLIVSTFTALTVSYQAISASLANPVDSLKEE
jgi:putative ABC transport system permease protein